jgi:hypothetical protein
MRVNVGDAKTSFSKLLAQARRERLVVPTAGVRIAAHDVQTIDASV